MINFIDVPPRCDQDGTCFPHSKVKDCVECALVRLHELSASLHDDIQDVKPLLSCIKSFDEFGRCDEFISLLKRCRNLLWIVEYNIIAEIAKDRGDLDGNA